MPSITPLAPISLVVAASTWGLVWYPYRLLQEGGIGGSVSSLLTYALGIPLLALLAWRAERGATAAQWPWLLGVALSAGWTNLSYVLAVIHGEVMRVMLLFYLAPLWTVLFARLLLGERAGSWGWAVIGLALAGAWTMLGGGAAGWPLPANTAEWLGLSSGLGFALTNVLTRRTRDIPIETRSLRVFAGVVAMSLLFMQFEGTSVATAARAGMQDWLMMAGITLALLLATFSVQYGLAHSPANRAIVILLSELVVAALSSQYLAGEAMGPREWLGGGMIVAATLFSMKLKHHE
ncbi:MAG: DMT family transporter [Pseudomonadota bacterium]